MFSKFREVVFTLNQIILCIRFKRLKKLTAISLLLILIFNIAGYRLLFNHLEKNATAKLENKIDEGAYSPEQLIEIKIPLSMPYYSDKDYEAVYGETEWNGQHYQYVKRKVSGNTLYLLCIPNHEKNNIAEAKNDFTKSVTETNQNSIPGKQQPTTIKFVLCEFIPQADNNQYAQQIINFFKHRISNSVLFSQFKPLTSSQPPEYFS
jgi:hypothetical protein